MNNIQLPNFAQKLKCSLALLGLSVVVASSQTLAQPAAPEDISVTGGPLYSRLSSAKPFPDGLVPQELVQEFAAGGPYYSTLPDGSPLAGLNLRPTAELQLIGSFGVDRMHGVLLHSNDSMDSVAQAVAPALIEDGWFVETNSKGEDIRSFRLCHDNYGYLNIVQRTLPQGGSSLTLRLTPRQPVPGADTCVGVQSLRDLRAFVLEVMDDLYPSLPPPPGAELGRWQEQTGPEVRSDSARFERIALSTVTLTNSSAAEVYEHFAARLSTQGWTEDSGSTGTRSATGLWLSTYKIPAIDCWADDPCPPTADLFLTLSVIAHAVNIYELRVSMVSGEPAPCSGGMVPSYCSPSDQRMPLGIVNPHLP